VDDSEARQGIVPRTVGLGGCLSTAEACMKLMLLPQTPPDAQRLTIVGCPVAILHGTRFVQSGSEPENATTLRISSVLKCSLCHLNSELVGTTSATHKPTCCMLNALPAQKGMVRPVDSEAPHLVHACISYTLPVRGLPTATYTNTLPLLHTHAAIRCVRRDMQKSLGASAEAGTLTAVRLVLIKLQSMRL
jgi:hypothetical protein